MAVEDRHIEEIANTRANLQTSLDNMQIAIETDNSENLVYKDDDGTYHIIPNLGDNVNFGNVLISSYVGYDADNMLTMTAALTYLKANGYKILDYLYSNGFISINPDGADIDFEISGTGYATAPIIHCNAGTNKVGIGTTTPSEKLDVVGSVKGSVSLLAPIVKAISSAGLSLQEDGGLGLTIQDATANLGVNQTNPTAKLDVVSVSNSEPVFRAKGTGTADLVNIMDNTTEVFTILDGGNVGIGTTTPAEKLDVSGNVKASGNISAMRKVAPVDVNNEYQFDGDVPASLVRYMEITLPTNSNARAAEAGKAVFTVKYYDDPDLYAAYRIDVAWMKITGIDQYVITNVKTGGGTVTPPDISEAFSIVSGKLRLTVTASLGAGEEGTAFVNGQIVEFVDWEVFSY